MLPCNVQFLAGVGTWEGISIRHPHIPRPWNPIRASDPILGPQETLIYASALIRPPTLQRRTLSGLHSYTPVERAPTPMSPVPEPRRRSLGDIPLPTGVQ